MDSLWPWLIMWRWRGETKCVCVVERRGNYDDGGGGAAADDDEEEEEDKAKELAQRFSNLIRNLIKNITQF